MRPIVNDRPFIVVASLWIRASRARACVSTIPHTSKYAHEPSSRTADIEVASDCAALRTCSRLLHTHRTHRAELHCSQSSARNARINTHCRNRQPRSRRNRKPLAAGHRNRTHKSLPDHHKRRIRRSRSHRNRKPLAAGHRNRTHKSLLTAANTALINHVPVAIASAWKDVIATS